MINLQWSSKVSQVSPSIYRLLLSLLQLFDYLSYFIPITIRGTQLQFAPFLMMLTGFFCGGGLEILCLVQDLSSPIRGQNCAPCSGSVESESLDSQRILDVHLDCLLKFMSASLPHCEVTLFFFESLSILGVISPLFFEYFLVFWHKIF